MVYIGGCYKSLISVIDLSALTWVLEHSRVDSTVANNACSMMTCIQKRNRC